MWTVIGGPYNSVFTGRRARRPIVAAVTATVTGGHFYPQHHIAQKPTQRKKDFEFLRKDLELQWEGIDPYTRKQVQDIMRPEVPDVLFPTPLDLGGMRDDIVQQVVQIMRDAEDDDDFLLMV